VWTLHVLFGLARTSMMVGAIAAFLAGLGRYFYRMPTSPP
jgi:hypothetical protein